MTNITLFWCTDLNNLNYSETSILKKYSIYIYTKINLRKFVKKNSQIIKEFFYWNFFSVSWFGVFHVKKHLWRHSWYDYVTLCEDILSNINFSFFSRSLQELYTIQKSYHQLYYSNIERLPVKYWILRKIPPSTFLLTTFFAQARKFDKMHHWISHKILHKKDYIVNFSKFFWG